MDRFSLFVLPFCIGVLLLAVFSVWKYIRWIKNFSPEQQQLVRKNILTWKFLPAVWESIREGLLHIRITKKNWLLGYMHRSLAFGWFLLIVVGAVQAAKAFPDGHPFWMAIFFNFFEVRQGEPLEFSDAARKVRSTPMDVSMTYGV